MVGNKLLLDIVWSPKRSNVISERHQFVVNEKVTEKDIEGISTFKSHVLYYFEGEFVIPND